MGESSNGNLNNGSRRNRWCNLAHMSFIDALTQKFQTLSLPRDLQCPLCGSTAKITKLLAENYTAACAPTPQSPMDSTDYPLEISVAEAKRLLDEEVCTSLLVDVREPYETEICKIAGSELIPMREIPARMHDLPRDEHLLVLCHGGARSMRVTEFLRAQGFTAVSNIAGGIDAWATEIDPTLRRY